MNRKITKLTNSVYQQLRRDRDNIIACRRNPFEEWPQARQESFKWLCYGIREATANPKMAADFIEVFCPKPGEQWEPITEEDLSMYPRWLLRVPFVAGGYSIANNTRSAQPWAAWWTEARPHLAEEFACDGLPASVWHAGRIDLDRVLTVELPETIKEQDRK